MDNNVEGEINVDKNQDIILRIRLKVNRRKKKIEKNNRRQIKKIRILI